MWFLALSILWFYYVGYNKCSTGGHWGKCPPSRMLCIDMALFGGSNSIFSWTTWWLKHSVTYVSNQPHCNATDFIFSWCIVGHTINLQIVMACLFSRYCDLVAIRQNKKLPKNKQFFTVKFVKLAFSNVCYTFLMCMVPLFFVCVFYQIY